MGLLFGLLEFGSRFSRFGFLMYSGFGFVGFLTWVFVILDIGIINEMDFLILFLFGLGFIYWAE